MLHFTYETTMLYINILGSNVFFSCHLKKKKGTLSIKFMTCKSKQIFTMQNIFTHTQQVSPPTTNLHRMRKMKRPIYDKGLRIKCKKKHK